MELRINIVYNKNVIIADHEIMKNEHTTTEHDNGVDIENDDDTPSLMNGDLDGNDHDSNDMGRPRKIRR